MSIYRAHRAVIFATAQLSCLLCTVFIVITYLYLHLFRYYFFLICNPAIRLPSRNSVQCSVFSGLGLGIWEAACFLETID